MREKKQGGRISLEGRHIVVIRKPEMLAASMVKISGREKQRQNKNKSEQEQTHSHLFSIIRGTTGSFTLQRQLKISSSLRPRSNRFNFGNDLLAITSAQIMKLNQNLAHMRIRNSPSSTF